MIGDDGLLKDYGRGQREGGREEGSKEGSLRDW